MRPVNNLTGAKIAFYMGYQPFCYDKIEKT